MPDPSPSLESWPAGPQGLDVLHRCAGIVQKQQHPGWGNSSRSPALTPSMEEWVNDLWIFLRESPRGRQEELRQLILGKSPSKLISVISRLYLNHVSDLRRRRDHSPWHAYYRHLRSVLAETPTITYRSSSQQAWYAWSSTDPGISHDFSESDFQAWPRPDVRGSEIKKAHTMRHLAAFFWQEAVKRSDQPCLVSVKNLTGYIAAMFPQELMPPRIRSEHASHAEDIGQPGILERTPADCSPPEQIITEARLEQLAEQFAAGLEEQEQRIWALRHGQDLKLEQI